MHWATNLRNCRPGVHRTEDHSYTVHSAKVLQLHRVDSSMQFRIAPVAVRSRVGFSSAAARAHDAARIGLRTKVTLSSVA